MKDDVGFIEVRGVLADAADDRSDALVLPQRLRWRGDVKEGEPVDGAPR